MEESDKDLKMNSAEKQYKMYCEDKFGSVLSQMKEIGDRRDKRIDDLENRLLKFLSNGIMKEIQEIKSTAKTAYKLSWWLLGIYLVSISAIASYLGWLTIFVVKHIAGGS